MSERIYCAGPVAPPKRQPSTDSPATHDAHVVTKRRTGGDRDGEVSYYFVGPQRATLSKAEEDLAWFRGEDIEPVGLTAAEINALPERVRAYVHDLETRSDPAGDIRTAHFANERSKALEIRAGEQAGALAALRRALEEVAGGCKGGRSDGRGACRMCGNYNLHTLSCRVGKALASDAGREEAEVIRAAVERREILRGTTPVAMFSGREGASTASDERLIAAVDALLAARVGEGEG